MKPREDTPYPSGARPDFTFRCEIQKASRAFKRRFVVLMVRVNTPENAASVIKLVDPIVWHFASQRFAGGSATPSYQLAS